jgi:hypothetical protein
LVRLRYILRTRSCWANDAKAGIQHHACPFFTILGFSFSVFFRSTDLLAGRFLVFVRSFRLIFQIVSSLAVEADAFPVGAEYENFIKNGSPSKQQQQLLLQARLAQSVARETLNLKVVGSSPTSGFSFCPCLFIELMVVSGGARRANFCVACGAHHVLRLPRA